MSLLFRSCLIGAVALAACCYSAVSFAQSDEVDVELTGNTSATECVILLHGLARSSASMTAMASTLADNNFKVANVDYPSRDYPVEALSVAAVDAGLDACALAADEQVHVVTHSLGGILIRDYLNRQDIPELKRIVMLAPPNHGSEVVDNLKSVPGFQWFNGPAGDQLGTNAASVPLQLGAISKETAVIAGTRSVNLILSMFLENPDDGKVSVASARLEGMCAMLILPVSHPFIMKDSVTMEQTIHYLKHGRFSVDEAEYFECTARSGDLTPIPALTKRLV